MSEILLQKIDKYYDNLLNISVESLTINSLNNKISSLQQTIRGYYDFISALVSCKDMAIEEYEFVKSEMESLKILSQEENEIKSFLTKISSTSNIKFSDKNEEDIFKETSKTLKDLSENFSKDLKDILDKLDINVELLGNNLKYFKVVLFGRTKAGKSTVREALTKGTGETIGKGGQSTTVEVNDYSWYNLKIFDTPGILSMKDKRKKGEKIGEEEIKAKEILEHADVAIFMFANDNIEIEELDYLYEIIKKGRDVLILLNIKEDITDYRMFKKRKKEETISLNNQLGHIKRILSHNGDNKKPNIKIIPIHAQAGFFSRAKDNNDVNSFFQKNEVSKHELYELSKFAEIRDYLVQNIKSNGKIIRVKTIREYFLEKLEGLVTPNSVKLKSVIAQLENVDKFYKKAEMQIHNDIITFSSKLKDKISLFVDENIDTRNIAESAIKEKWNKDDIHLEMEKLIKKTVKEAPIEILSELMDKIKERLEDVEENINFDNNLNSDFNLDIDHTDYKNFFKVGSILAGISSALVFALSKATAIGWIISIGSFFLATIAGLLASEETKIKNLKKELDKKVATDVINNLYEGIKKAVNEQAKPKIQESLDDFKKEQVNRHKIANAYKEINDKMQEKIEKNRKSLDFKIKQLKQG